MTVLPRSVGSFFSSRSSERSKLRAVASNRSTSSRSRSLIEIRCRLGGSFGGSRSSRTTRISALRALCSTGVLPFASQYDLVDLVDLDELHVNALVAVSREVLANVVRADRQLAVAAVGQHGELHARGAAVVEERLDCGANRAPRVEDVVEGHAGHAVECEVELRVADERLRVLRRLAAADVDVVAVEGDVELAERDFAAREVGDPPAQALGERDAAGMDPDEGDRIEIGVALDDLVRNPGERPVDVVAVEKDRLALGVHNAHARGRSGAGTGTVIRNSFPASRDRVKGASDRLEP